MCIDVSATMPLELPDEMLIENADRAAGALIDEVSDLIHIVERVAGDHQRGMLGERPGAPHGRFTQEDLHRLAHVVTFATTLERDAQRVGEFARELKDKSLETYQRAQHDVAETKHHREDQ